MKHEIPMKGGLEYDALTGWHFVLCYMSKPGLRKWVKRKYNKRVRRSIKSTVNIEMYS